MTEARYRGQKVVVVSPDYAEHTKFADHWLPAEAGTDGALAMAMGHVILKEFYVDRAGAVLPATTRGASPTCRCSSRCASATTARTSPSRFLRASDLGERRASTPSGSRSCSTQRTASRWSRTARSASARASEGKGRWNLELGRGRAGADAARRARRAGRGRRCRASTSARARAARSMRRGVPAMRVGGRLVTTVLDLLLAQYGVAPRRAARRVAGGLRRLRQPYTPAWQEPITGVDAGRVRAGRARVRPQRRAHRRPLDDRDGRRHQPLVPLRPDLPGDPRRWCCSAAARASTAAAGRTTSARRRCGRWPAGRRRLRARLDAAAAPAARRRRSSTWRPTSGATSATGPASSPRRSGAACSTERHIADCNALGGAARLAAVVPELRPQPARPRRRGRARGRRPGRARRLASCARAGCASPARTPTPPTTTRGC